MDNLKSKVTAIQFRRDGKMLAIGEESGFIQLIETKRRGVIRNYKRHDKAVSAIAWKQGESALFSGSDDLVSSLEVLTTS